MLLTDEEISLMAHNEDDGDWNDLRFRDTWHAGYKAGARAIEAAILAKLASADLPKPTVYSYNVQTHMNVLDAYSADQLRQAYAQGAAAQLAEKPSAWKLDGVGKATRVVLYEPSDEHRQIYSCIYELYTRRQA